MPAPIHLEGHRAEILVEAPEHKSDAVAIFLPGISGGAFSDRYKPLVDACLGGGIAMARLSLYADTAELNNKTIEQMHGDIDAAVSFLKSHGYKKIFGIGKSFGGALMLTYPSADIAARVVWAPAISAMETGANIDAYKGRELGSVPLLLDIKVDRDFLQGVPGPVLVIHGTADDQIPLSNSEHMVSMLPNAKLFPIEGADHSYKNKDHETIVIEETVKFLTANR